MRDFRNILYVSFGIEDETEGLKQALSLARNNQAALKILVISPKFSTYLSNYSTQYETFLKEQINKVLEGVRTVLKLGDGELPVEICIESNDLPPAEYIIRQVLREKYDLLVKEAKSTKNKEGFEAIDMNLLRKCPCAILLCRPIKHSRKDIQVAAAVDPKNEEQAAHALSLNILELSRLLADTCSGKLDIISCWEFEHEESLRYNVFIKVSQDELRKAVMATERQHKAALEALIKEANISGEYTDHHLKGEPAQRIPAFVKDENIDILVMGTVARTGIRGFLIGNTAENIVQKLSCSLLALKPRGFVSPVAVYD
ncbi:MAG: universal stress protein [Gammaproteobacteria bacterium]